ncbi:MAG: hypothetical protein KC425_26120 [Anaerolineales bacterium]|nr:hypothetical protein [Anaerolineales bacterium]
MNNKNVSIEAFNKLLNGSQESAMLSVLRKLTQVKQTDKLVKGIPEPGPLGAWPGWDY